MFLHSVCLHCKLYALVRVYSHASRVLVICSSTICMEISMTIDHQKMSAFHTILSEQDLCKRELPAAIPYSFLSDILTGKLKCCYENKNDSYMVVFRFSFTTYMLWNHPAVIFENVRLNEKQLYARRCLYFTCTLLIVVLIICSSCHLSCSFLPFYYYTLVQLYLDFDRLYTLIYYSTFALVLK